MTATRWSLALVALVTAAFEGDARAQAWSVPVYVSVVGSGSIRVRVAAGDTVPCDSSRNAPLFDGLMSAGTTTQLQSPYGCICEQHTHGAFRQVDWTPSQIWCQQVNPWTGEPLPYVAITVSTDG